MGTLSLVGKTTKKNKTKTIKKKIKKQSADTGLAFAVTGFDFHGQEDSYNKENEQELRLFDEAIPQEGDNVFMVLPGTQETKGNMLVTKRGHGFKCEGCSSATRNDIWQGSCPSCTYWRDNRTSKDDKARGLSHPADNLYAVTRGYVQIVNLTPFVEHESVRDGDKVVEKPVSDEIDMSRVKQKPCFLNTDELKPETKKCKECFAFYSCFQGPQFLGLSGDRVKEMMHDQAKLGGAKVRKGHVKIGGKKISLKGNIALAWWTLTARAMNAASKEELKKARGIAAKIGFPLVYTKTVDPNKDKRYGTKYSVGFSNSTFVMPATWQDWALKRARNIVEFCRPLSHKEASEYFANWKASNSGKPACFNDADLKDGESCLGDDCKYYDECAVKANKESSKKSGSSKKIGSKKKTKQSQVDDMMDDDDGDEDLIAKLKKRESRFDD